MHLSPPLGHVQNQPYFPFSTASMKNLQTLSVVVLGLPCLLIMTCWSFAVEEEWSALNPEARLNRIFYLHPNQPYRPFSSRLRLLLPAYLCIDSFSPLSFPLLGRGWIYTSFPYHSSLACRICIVLSLDPPRMALSALVLVWIVRRFLVLLLHLLPSPSLVVPFRHLFVFARVFWRRLLGTVILRFPFLLGHLFSGKRVSIIVIGPEEEKNLEMAWMGMKKFHSIATHIFHAKGLFWD